MKKVLHAGKTVLLIIIIVLFVITTCVSYILNAFSQTLFKSGYVKAELSEYGVYGKIVDEVKEDVKREYRRKGNKNKELDSHLDKLLDFVILEEPLKKEIEESVDELYGGRKIIVSKEDLLKEYSDGTRKFLTDNRIDASEETVGWLINQIADRVTDSIDLNKYTEIISESYARLISLFKEIRLVCGIFGSLFFVLIIAFYKDRLKKIGLVSVISGGILVVLSSVMLTLSSGLDSSAHTLQRFISSILVHYFITLMLLAIGDIFFGVTFLIISKYRKDHKKTNEKREKIEGVKLPVDESDTIHLLSKKKKGLLRIIFSRAGLTAILLLLQAVLLFVFFSWFDEYDGLFTIISLTFRLIMIMYLFDCDMDATAKLTWLVLMILFPAPGSVLLLITQKNIGHRKLGRKLSDMTANTKGKIEQDQSILKDSGVMSSGTEALCSYLNLSGTFPLYNNTSVKYYPLGEYKFIDMLEELKKAEKFIFMEYFIIGEGLMWGSILKILKEKAEQGVEVRVMYDGMCEISTLTPDYPKRLEKLGIKCKAFSKLHPFISTHYNYRDHRKILVIDGRVAFNGGVNLADEYINHEDRFGHWKDTAVMLKGDAVDSFTLMFLQMWNITEKNMEWDKYLGCGEKAESDGFIMPYADCPLDKYKVGENIYIDILNRAQKYVHIMTPYLILDNELEAALKFAAQRDVDVKLILPGVPDKKTAYSLAKSHYRYLIDAGVKIYEYSPGFVHAKVFVSDDEKAVTGTINLDYRSLYHHFECATYMYKASCISQIEEDFNNTLSKCRTVTHETIKKEKLSYKFRGRVLKLIAPLM